LICRGQLLTLDLTSGVHAMFPARSNRISTHTAGVFAVLAVVVFGIGPASASCGTAHHYMLPKSVATEAPLAPARPCHGPNCTLNDGPTVPLSPPQRTVKPPPPDALLLPEVPPEPTCLSRLTFSPRPVILRHLTSIFRPPRSI
jgi:hypothetical protein